MLLSSSAVCNSEKSRFNKEQEANGLLSSLEITTTLNKISVVGPLLFQTINKLIQGIK